MNLGAATSIGVGVFFAWQIATSPRLDPAPPASLPLVAPFNPQRFVIPVRGVSPDSLVDTWGQSREGGARLHQAIDIAAPLGTPVLAAKAGTVEKRFASERGGLTLCIRSADRRWQTYYAHLSGYAGGLVEGQPVAAGQVVGFVGDSGNAGPGNTHLHFALHRMSPADAWHGGTPINPYPLLARAPTGR